MSHDTLLLMQMLIKLNLQNIRNKQKAMIKDGSAISGSIDWQVNGSAAQGRKMIKDMQNYCFVHLIVNVMKLLIR